MTLQTDLNVLPVALIPRSLEKLLKVMRNHADERTDQALWAFVAATEEPAGAEPQESNPTTP